MKELPSEFQLPTQGEERERKRELLGLRLGLALRIWPVFALKGYWIKPQNRPRTNVIINSPKLRQRLMLSDMMPIHSKIVGLFLGAILAGGQTDGQTYSAGIQNTSDKEGKYSGELRAVIMTSHGPKILEPL